MSIRVTMDDLVTQIKTNHDLIRARIEKAASSVGRNPQDVKLIVVSKNQPDVVVQAAIQAGIREFGENYPEQAVEKIQKFSLQSGLRWHMIGHLQSRKAKLVVENFHYLHSLDSLSLAHKLDQILERHGKVLPVLLEFNVGGEESKYGWNAQDEKKWDLLLPDIEEITLLPHLKIQGLMTMPPYDTDLEKTRPFFTKLANLRDFLWLRFPEHDWFELSMGTSVDFEAAVQEGATYVRIGQAILGERPKTR